MPIIRGILYDAHRINPNVLEGEASSDGDGVLKRGTERRLVNLSLHILHVCRRQRAYETAVGTSAVS